MQSELRDIRKSVRNALGAIESNQVVDKDVHGTLTGVLSRIDALTAAQSDYETRIRSALVDVPAEPVCTVALIGAAGFRWLAPHPIDALDHLPVGTPLYTSPPLSSEGEDSSEVIEAGERFLKACDAYVDGEEIPDETLMVEYGDALEAFRTVLAATRSGSAREAKGNGE